MLLKALYDSSVDSLIERDEQDLGVSVLSGHEVLVFVGSVDNTQEKLS